MREEEEICIHNKMNMRPVLPVNRKLENNTNRGRVTSLCTLDVITPPVLYIEKFVFPKVSQADFCVQLL